MQTSGTAKKQPKSQFLSKTTPNPAKA